MEPSLFLQLVVSGLTVGGVYAVVAMGLVVVYKATDVVNFAQGEFLTLGAYLGLFFYVTAGLSYPLAFIAAIAVCAVVGMIIERATIRPLLNSPEFTIIMATFAIATMIRAVLRIIWRDYTFSFPPIASTQPLEFLGVRQSPQNLLVLAIALAIIALLFLFFQRTKIGLAMRATALNREAAWLMGVNVTGVFGLTWAMSAGLGTAAGLLIAPLVGIHPEMGHIMIKAFVAALLGGFNSLPGALIGGLALGVMETVAGGFLSNYFKEILTFAIMMLVIVFMPNGFFGSSVAKKV
jgi:branched-chain amino acid transport system permease protein